MLLWTLMFKYLFESMLSILLIVSLEVELLNSVIILCLLFGAIMLFSTAPVTILLSNHQYTWVPISPRPCQHFFFCCCHSLFVHAFVIMDFIMDVQWHSTVFWICISLVISTIEYVTRTYWPSIYYLWINVYSIL